MFIINFLILIAPFVDFVLFFSRWNIFLIFFRVLGLSYWSRHTLWWFCYISLELIPFLLSSAYLNFPRVHCNIFFNNSTLKLLLVSNIEELEVCGDVSMDCPFVTVFLLCFVHLVNRPVFQVFPSSSTSVLFVSFYMSLLSELPALGFMLCTTIYRENWFIK